MVNGMSFVDKWFATKLFGYRRILDAIGNILPERGQIKVLGFPVSDSVPDAATVIDASSISAAQHGNLPGGPLHAVANSVDAGFMSATDKVKLDQLSAGSAARVTIARASSIVDQALAGPPLQAETDDVLMANGETLLLLGQTTASENGPWIVQSGGNWTRPTEYTPSTGKGGLILVLEGTVRAGFVYQNTNVGAVADEVTLLTYSRITDRFDRVALAGATATPTADQITKFGLSSELAASSFRATGAPAQSGLLRADNNTTAVAFRNQAGDGDVGALSISTTNEVQVGSSAATGLRAALEAASSLFFDFGGTAKATFRSSVLALFATPDAGGGDGIWQLGNATTEPTAGSPTSTLAWAALSTLKLASKDFIWARLVPYLQTGSAIPGMRWRDVAAGTVTTTNDATVKTVITYALPESSTNDFRATIVAYSTDGPSAARFLRTGAVVRYAAGAAQFLGSVDSSIKQDLGSGTWVGNVAVSGNDITVTFQGPGVGTATAFCFLEMGVGDF